MAAGSTYTPIQTTTLGSAQSTVALNSIPTTYTDLILVVNTRFTGGGGASVIQLQFNGDTATNYSYTTMNGSGTSVTSARATTQSNAALGLAIDTANEWCPSIFHLMNYANTTTYKTVLSRSGVASDRVRFQAGLWAKTPEAITSILLLNNGATTFVSGSTFTLYGIAAA